MLSRYSSSTRPIREQRTTKRVDHATVNRLSYSTAADRRQSLPRRRRRSRSQFRVSAYRPPKQEPPPTDSGRPEQYIAEQTRLYIIVKRIPSAGPNVKRGDFRKDKKWVCVAALPYSYIQHSDRVTEEACTISSHTLRYWWGARTHT